MALQNRLLRIIFKRNIDNITRPILIKESFILESIVYHYKLSNNHKELGSKTRNNSIILPKINKSLSYKNSEYVAVKYFNKLPNNLKKLNVSKKTLKHKIFSWIRNMGI
jgi:hypothetical protein